MVSTARSEGPADLVVVGKAVKVEPGVGMRWVITDDGDERTVVAFEDESAEMRTFHITLEIEEALAPTKTGESTGELVFGATFEPDVSLSDVRKDFLGAGEIVPFLSNDGPIYDYDPGVMTVLESGALMGVVSEKGVVEFPFLNPRDSLNPTDSPTVGKLAALE